MLCPRSFCISFRDLVLCRFLNASLTFFFLFLDFPTCDVRAPRAHLRAPHMQLYFFFSTPADLVAYQIGNSWGRGQNLEISSFNWVKDSFLVKRSRSGDFLLQLGRGFIALSFYGAQASTQPAGATTEPQWGVVFCKGGVILGVPLAAARLSPGVAQDGGSRRRSVGHSGP